MFRRLPLTRVGQARRANLRPEVLAGQSVDLAYSRGKASMRPVEARRIEHDALDLVSNRPIFAASL